MNDNVHIINLSAYTQPEVVESPQQNWVLYGKKNDYYDWLIDRYRNSATNNAVINNVIKLIYGNGLKAHDASKNVAGYAMMKKLFTKKVLKAVITDFKMLGGGCFQVIYSKDHKTIVEVQHLPINLIRPQKCNKEGVIEGYWFSNNWAKINDFKPVYIPAFGTSKEGIELVVFGNYSVGRKYFHEVDYQGCLDYCVLEEKISEYLVNETSNSFSGTKVINFNNGRPAEGMETIEANKVKAKFTGSTGDKVIVAFNDNKENGVTIEDIQLDNAPEHYAYLSKEAQNKILAAHNVISSMLVGVPLEGSGFSSTADEIEVAALYFSNSVILSLQETVLEPIDMILGYNGVFLDLYFERKNLLNDNSSNKLLDSINSLSPLVANKVLESMSPDEIRELIGLRGIPNGAIVQLSKDELEDYELVDSRVVVYEHEQDLDSQIEKLNEKPKTLLSNVFEFLKTSTGIALPKRSSEQDSELFKVRYRYSGEVGDNTRTFCKKMLAANKLYRKEDIELMSNSVVNEGWGPEGADTYDIFLYKGGGDCHHFWTRETYRRKGTDITSPLAKQVTPAQARKEGEILPTNPMKVYTKPVDMPYNGFLPTNKRFK